MTLSVRKDDGEVTAAVPGLKWTYETLSDLLNPASMEAKNWREQQRESAELAKLLASVPQIPKRRKSS